jgi:hypothetical protein
MTSASWVSCGQRVVWDMGRTLREPPYGLAEPLPIRVPAGSKHQNALERSGLITRGRTAQLRDSPLKETPRRPRRAVGRLSLFTRKRQRHQIPRQRLLLVPSERERGPRSDACSSREASVGAFRRAASVLRKVAVGRRARETPAVSQEPTS